jgi:hypothetical protein
MPRRDPTASRELLVVLCYLEDEGTRLVGLTFGARRRTTSSPLAHWQDEDACLIAVTISRGGFCSSAFASVLTAEFDGAEFGEEGAISGGRAVTSTRRPT